MTSKELRAALEASKAAREQEAVNEAARLKMRDLDVLLGTTPFTYRYEAKKFDPRSFQELSEMILSRRGYDIYGNVTCETINCACGRWRLMLVRRPYDYEARAGPYTCKAKDSIGTGLEIHGREECCRHDPASGWQTRLSGQGGWHDSDGAPEWALKYIK